MTIEREMKVNSRVMLLMIIILALTGAGQVTAYSQQDLLTWMQSSNFGYQVLQQSLHEDVSILASEDARCVAQARLLLAGADAHAVTALRVLDAWGKFPHGLLYGHFSDMGNFDACLSLGSLQLSPTKYCLTHIEFDSLLPQVMNTLSVRIGACIPASCSAAKLNHWLQDYLAQLFEQGEEQVPQAVMLQEQNCAVTQRNPMTGLDWFAVVLLGFLLLLVLLSTLLDTTKASLTAPGKLLTVFSLRRNLRQLLHTTSTTAVPSHVIPCLHGIRCLTIIWIIYGHDNMFMLLSPNVNAYEIVTWAQTPYSMILQSGATSVDTFFLLSGMLLVMSTLRELDRRNGHLNVPLMYLHRIVRLTPVLAVAVLFYMTLFPRLDSGPLWQQFSGSYQLCSDTWWATLLFVQNYAAAGRMCLGHSWYLAVDMQLFLLSPLLLWPLWRWRRRAAAGVVLLVLLLFGCLFSIIMLNELRVFDRQGNLGEDSPAMRMIYYTTHARAMPWLIGLLFGYFLHSERGRRRRLSWPLVLLLWLLACSMVVAVIWSMYPYTQPGAGEISPLAGAFYLCCSRIAWPLSLCWLIWACQSGRAGAINTLLSWSFWQPISKLSYCLYLWHLLVETLNIGRIRTGQHFSNYDAVLRFWGDFGVTLLVSLCMYLCVEAPLVQLELHLLSRHRQRQQTAPATSPNNNETNGNNDSNSNPMTPTVSLAVISTPYTSVSQENLVDT